MHPLINPKTFLGDSVFDTIPIYQSLFQEWRFEKAYIPLNNRSKLAGGEYYTINDDGIPCCPHDASLPMKPEGNTSHLRCVPYTTQKHSDQNNDMLQPGSNEEPRVLYFSLDKSSQ